MIFNPETIKMRLYHKSPFAVAAFEAGFMVSLSISSQEINKVDGLVASLALVQSPGEC